MKTQITTKDFDIIVEDATPEEMELVKDKHPKLYEKYFKSKEQKGIITTKKTKQNGL
jgi:hypothetical protein